MDIRTFFNKILSYLLYGAKYLVYLMDLAFFKIKTWVTKYPKYAIAAGGLTIVILFIIGIFGRSILTFLTTPRPPQITTAPSNTGFQYQAKDDKFKVTAYIGDLKTNSPKVETKFKTASVDFTLSDISQNISKPTQSGNTITFNNVKNNVDLKYETLVNGIKESLILKSIGKGNIFYFDLNAKGAVPKKLGGNIYNSAFFDSGGNYLFGFAKPFAFDAKGARTENVVLTVIKTAEDSYKIKVTVNEKWLSDPARVYPITVDPTVVYSTLSAFGAGTFNRATDSATNGTASALTADVNTVTLWHMDEASGTAVADSSGNGYAATSASTSNVGAGKFGNARTFNGTSSTNVSYSASSGSQLYNPIAPLTLEAWINPSSVSAVQGIVCSGASASYGFCLFLDSNGKVGFDNFGGGTFEGSTVLTTGNWYHVAGVINGSSSKIYVNGALDGTGTITIPAHSGSGGYIGSEGGLSAFFNGSIDEVRISIAARSDAEIAADAAANPNLTGTYRELPADQFTKGLWHFDETSGNPADSSGNGNTLTPTGTVIRSGPAGMGNARSFGSSNYLSLATPSLPTGSVITAEAWIYPTAYADATYNGIVSWGGRTTANAFLLSIQNTGRLSFASWGNDFVPTTGPTAALNQWNHVAAVLNGQSILLYLNGQLAQSGKLTSTPNVTSSNFEIGATDWGGTRYFTGYIDEVRVSNTFRSPEEIRLDAQKRPYATFTSDVIDFNAATTGFNPLTWTEVGVNTGSGEILSNSANLIAQWNFNSTSGTTATADAGSCGASCNGTLTNMITDAQDAAPQATGGTITFSGGYEIHTFTASGTFTPNHTMTVDALVVGGGGGGGTIGAGGGAGGYLYQAGFAVTAQAYAITVGGGGNGGSSACCSRGSNGTDSIFSTLDAVGGGGGGSSGGGTNAGLNGGSGGGGGGSAATGSNAAGGSPTSGQGFKGGTGGGITGNWGGNGGGGGAGSAGTDVVGTSLNGTNGGTGTTNSINGTATCYAGGGNGGEVNGTAVGTASGCGQGAATVNAAGGNGGTNLGAGGGGGSFTGAAYTAGGNGGSGIVIIRFPQQPSGWTATNARWGTGALGFNGLNSYVDAGNNAALQITGALSTEAWIKTSGPTSSPQGIVAKNGSSTGSGQFGYLLRSSNTGVAEFGISSDGTAYTGVTGTTNINDGNWHYLAGVYVPSTSLSIYVDGVLQKTNTTSIPASIHNSPGDLSVGSTYIATGAEFFNGIIDSPRVYNRSITASEILSNYNAGNIDFQTRVGDTTDPNDGTWEAWAPVTSETQIQSLDADSANWSTDLTLLPIGLANDTIVKYEGSGSLRVQEGVLQLSDANVAGLWHLNETGGSGAYIKDATTNANNGTPAGTALVTGIDGKARSFNGTSDYISVADSASLQLATPMTLEVWFKTTVTPGAGTCIVRKESASGTRYMYGISMDVSGKVYGQYYNVTSNTILLSSTTVTDGNWHHAALTISGTTASSYLDGALQATGTISGTQGVPNGELDIGACPPYVGPNPRSGFFSGTVDEVRISNVARSALQIKEDAYLGVGSRLSRTLVATDISAAQKLSFDVAADKPGTYLEAAFSNNAYSNWETDASTVGLWHLDVSPQDFSASANTGTANGTIAQASGKMGYDRVFDGSSAYISVNDSVSLQLSTALTIEGWIKTGTTPATRSCIARKDTASGTRYLYSINVETTGNAAAEYFNSSADYVVTSGSPITDNNWHYIAGTISGTAISLYVDGLLQGVASISAPQAAPNGELDIGACPPFVGGGVRASFINGAIDEVRVSNVARSAADIRAAYEYGKRAHEITIDFAANLTSAIASSAVKSFTIDATQYGLATTTSNIYPGDKIIVHENYNGTDSYAQGTVQSVTASTNTVVVESWDAASTFPGGGQTGFSTNANVFKWQREYMDLNGVMAAQKNAVTRLTLRTTNQNEGRNVWLDDIRSVGNYLTTPGGSTVTSSAGHEFFQYRTVYSTNDYNVGPTLTAATVDFNTNAPNPPTISAPSNITSTGVQWNFAGGGGTITGFKVYDTTNTLKATCVGAAITSCTETGLTPNTAYTRKVAAYNATGNSLYSLTQTAITLANAPLPVSLASPTATTVVLSANASSNSNPASTEYAVYVQSGSSTCTGSGGNYLSTVGTLVSYVTWATSSVWNNITVSGLNLDTTQYTFCIKAHNNTTGVPVDTAWTGNTTNGGYMPLAGSYTLNGGNMTFSNKKVDTNNAARYVEGLDVGPTGWWHLDEASGNAADASGNAFTLTNSNVTFVAGKYNNAGSFNGTSSNLTCTDAACGGVSNLDIGTRDFTLSAWINTSSASTPMEIVRKGSTATNVYYLRLESGKLAASYNDGTTTVSKTGSTTINNGVWHNVAMSVTRSSGITLYVDGNVDGTQSGSAAASMDNPDNFCVGSYGSSSCTAEFFNGLIDEVRVYPVALTQFQIKQDMNTNNPQNVSTFTVKSGTLTINAGESFAVGQLVFPSGSTGSVAIASFQANQSNPAQVKPAAPFFITAKDDDKDSYYVGDFTKAYYGTAAQSGWRRRSVLTYSTSKGADCDDTVPANIQGYQGYIVFGAICVPSGGGTGNDVNPDSSPSWTGTVNLSTFWTRLRVGNYADDISYTVSAIGTNTITTSAAPNGISAGDEIVIINMRGDSTNHGNVGNYEDFYITNVTGSVITVYGTISKWYGAGNTNSSLTGQTVMVQRVPNYSSMNLSSGMTLTANAFNGTLGGLLTFRVYGTATITGNITMAASGYGGNSASNPGYSIFIGTGGVGGSSQSVVGTAGTSSGGGGGGASNVDPGGSVAGGGSSGTGATGGGGGGGIATGTGTGIDSFGGGGGGGANGGAGLKGINTGASLASDGSSSASGAGGNAASQNAGGGGGGANNLYSSTLTILTFGGGGGGGGQGCNSSKTCSAGTTGGTGGGMILIGAATLSVSGSIIADGGNGTNAAFVYTGTGGGGAGGSIKIDAPSATIGTNLIHAVGGAGGTGSVHSAGGAGGAGIIAIHGTVTGTTNPTYTAY